MKKIIFTLITMTVVMVLTVGRAIAQDFFWSDRPGTPSTQVPWFSSSDQRSNRQLCIANGFPTLQTEYYICNAPILCGDPSFTITNYETGAAVGVNDVVYQRVNTLGDPATSGGIFKVQYKHAGIFKVYAYWNCGVYTESRTMIVTVTDYTNNPAIFSLSNVTNCPSPNTAFTINRINSTNPINQYYLDILEVTATGGTIPNAAFWLQPGTNGWAVGNMKTLTPALPSSFFQVGHTYRVKLGVSSPCSTWSEATQLITIAGPPIVSTTINGSTAPVTITTCQPIILNNNSVVPLCGTKPIATITLRNTNNNTVISSASVSAGAASYDLKSVFPVLVAQNGDYSATLSISNFYSSASSVSNFTLDYRTNFANNASAPTLIFPCSTNVLLQPGINTILPPCGTNTIELFITNANNQAIPLRSGTGTVFTAPYSAVPRDLNAIFPINEGVGDFNFGVHYTIINSIYGRSDDINQAMTAYYASVRPTTSFGITSGGGIIASNGTIFSCQNIRLINPYTPITGTCLSATSPQTYTLRMQPVGGATASAISVPAAQNFDLTNIFNITNTTPQGSYDITLTITNQFGTSTNTQRVNLSTLTASNAEFKLAGAWNGGSNPVLPRSLTIPVSNELGSATCAIYLTGAGGLSNVASITSWKVDIWETDIQGGNIPLTLMSSGNITSTPGLSYPFNNPTMGSYFANLSETDRLNKRFRVRLSVTNQCGTASNESFFKIKTNCTGCRAVNNDATASLGFDTDVMPATLATSVSPNPATNEVLISYNLPTDDFVSLSVYDALGKVISTPFAEIAQSNGLQTYTLNLESWAAGIYFYTLQTASGKVSGKFSKQ